MKKSEELKISNSSRKPPPDEDMSLNKAHQQIIELEKLVGTLKQEKLSLEAQQRNTEAICTDMNERVQPMDAEIENLRDFLSRHVKTADEALKCVHKMKCMKRATEEKQSKLKNELVRTKNDLL